MDDHKGRRGEPAIRVIMMPKDTNALGTIFGGIILSYIDQAGAVEGHRVVSGRLVTVALREVVFHAPVFVGDLVSFYTEPLKVGRTSMQIRIEVIASRDRGATDVKVTEGLFTFVALDDEHRPRAVDPA